MASKHQDPVAGLDQFMRLQQAGMNTLNQRLAEERMKQARQEYREKRAIAREEGFDPDALYPEPTDEAGNPLPWSE